MLSKSKKLIEKDCGCTHELNQPKQLAKKDCKSCKGTGKLEDSMYYIIDNKNKIAFDSDFEDK